VPNDLSVILSAADIRAIYANGAKSYELYEKYIFPVHGIAAHKLPSTSPANAGYSFDRLLDAWKEILQFL
jgi:G:T/U-mismatch repair DNA glycosylase